MGLNLSDQMNDQLMAYLNLVEKWNRVYNLTAIRDRAEMIKLHFLDSLSILNYVNVKICWMSEVVQDSQALYWQL